MTLQGGCREGWHGTAAAAPPAAASCIALQHAPSSSCGHALPMSPHMPYQCPNRGRRARRTGASCRERRRRNPASACARRPCARGQAGCLAGSASARLPARCRLPRARRRACQLLPRACCFAQTLECDDDVRLSSEQARQHASSRGARTDKAHCRDVARHEQPRRQAARRRRAHLCQDALILQQAPQPQRSLAVYLHHPRVAAQLPSAPGHL